MRKVMIFGTFDGVHDGHRHLFAEAKQHGDYLIAVIASDDTVFKNKKRLPNRTAYDRLEYVCAEPHVDRAIMGDAESEAWRVLWNHRPHVVVAGYDQGELFAALDARLGEFPWGVELVRATPHKPETYHSRFLRRNKNIQ